MEHDKQDECGCELESVCVYTSLFTGLIEVLQCPQCGDTAERSAPDHTLCSHCDGTGSVVSYVTGQILECWTCRGRGVIKQVAS